MAGDGLGMSGTGAGMFSRLFDVGIDLGTTFGKKTLGIQPGVNQATRLGLTEPQVTAAAPGSLTVSNQPSGFQFDQKTILIGLAVIVLAVMLAKS